MPQNVKGRRPYRSPRRRAAGRRDTRRAILDSAKRLFERHGYAVTTMDSIAQRRGRLAEDRLPRLRDEGATAPRRVGSRAQG